MKLIKVSLFLIVLIWNIGIFWEFIAAELNFGISFLPFLKYNYSIVCHSESEKLLQFGNLSTLTCSRCTGIYTGGLFAAFLILFIRKFEISTKIFLLLSLPMFADIIIYSSGLYEYNKIIAALTGILLGSAGFIYIQKSLIELLANRSGR